MPQFPAQAVISAAIFFLFLCLFTSQNFYVRAVQLFCLFVCFRCTSLAALQRHSKAWLTYHSDFSHFMWTNTIDVMPQVSKTKRKRTVFICVWTRPKATEVAVPPGGTFTFIVPAPLIQHKPPNRCELCRLHKLSDIKSPHPHPCFPPHMRYAKVMPTEAVWFRALYTDASRIYRGLN